jgi:hypothetical protein
LPLPQRGHLQARPRNAASVTVGKVSSGMNVFRARSRAWF